jgi:hypothetical protein
MKYHQESNSDESYNFDEENQQHKPKGQKMKMHFDTYQNNMYYQSCYNGGHYRKKCKIFKKFC